MELILFEQALIARTIGKSFYAVSVLLVICELANIFLARRPGKRSLAIQFVVTEVSLVFVATREGFCAHAHIRG